jgi:hypothetical protein
MIGLRRRNLMRTGLAAALIGLTRRQSQASEECDRTIRLGAIRWDAWYDPDDRIGRATAAALSPKDYRFRLPFFAKIGADADVTIDGNHQDIFEQEIRYAVQAELSYWAFVAYPHDSALTRGLHLYLDSTSKHLINFCMLSELTNWRNKDIAEYHVQIMTDPSYQTVLDKRPLYFLGFLRDEAIQSGWGGRPGLRQALDAFRARIIRKGLNTPYIVILDHTPELAAGYARDLGCDAISTYAINHNPRAAPFKQLVHEAERDWTARAATGIPVVPTITTGFDQRPRVQTPWPWQASRADSTSQYQFYYDTARPEEIRGELAACVRWIHANAVAVPSMTALVYAWNENDEGGWLIPTYPNNTGRLTAMHEGVCMPKLP